MRAFPLLLGYVNHLMWDLLHAKCAPLPSFPAMFTIEDWEYEVIMLYIFPTYTHYVTANDVAQEWGKHRMMPHLMLLLLDVMKKERKIGTGRC